MKTLLIILILVCGQAIGQSNYTNMWNNFSATNVCFSISSTGHCSNAVGYTNYFKTPLQMLRDNNKIPEAIIELRDSGELCTTLGHQWHEGTSYGVDEKIARKLDCIWCKKVKTQVIKRQPATFWEDVP